MNLGQETIDRFAKNLSMRGKLPATVESYCRDARGFMEYIGQHSLAVQHLTPETLVTYQDFLIEKKETGNSVRRTVIGVRQFFRFLSEQRVIDSSPFDAVMIPERNDQLPLDLKKADIDRLIELVSRDPDTFKAMRDAAIICLLAYEGIKATELIGLRWRDYLGSDVGKAASLRINGSRGRNIELSPETVAVMMQYRERYKAVEHPILRTAQDPKMFIAFKGRDAAMPIPHMTRHGLKFIIYELGKLAGINQLNSELLRHYAVSHQLGLGRSPEQIMLNLGLRTAGNVAKHAAKLRRQE